MSMQIYNRSDKKYYIIIKNIKEIQPTSLHSEEQRIGR
jgi:hypothetical protein